MRLWTYHDSFIDMLRAKWPWGNIADIVRLRGALLDNVKGEACWIIDLDTVWLKKEANCGLMPFSVGAQVCEVGRTEAYMW